MRRSRSTNARGARSRSVNVSQVGCGTVVVAVVDSASVPGSPVNRPPQPTIAASSGAGVPRRRFQHGHLLSPHSRTRDANATNTDMLFVTTARGAGNPVSVCGSPRSSSRIRRRSTSP